jgi:hypothetical protein
MHVLTFNYDRLFEMAFLDRIGTDLGRRFALYSDALLNSGLNQSSSDISFASGRFSFLKLHGSVGAWVQYETGGPQFYPFDNEGFCSAQTKDSRFFPEKTRIKGLYPSPLIIFPCEKQHIQSGGRHTYYEKYISAVWGKAAELIAEAAEIHIVGYSFNPLDCNSLIQLLANANKCERGIIQNIGTQAKRICEMLEIEHPEISIPWRPYDCEF